MKLKYNFFSQTIIQALRENGIHKNDIFALPGITPDTRDPLESEISIEFIHHLVLYYKKRLDTPHCGLAMIQRVDFRNADFFGPYAFSCPTLGEAVKKMYAVYSRLNPLVRYEMGPAEKPCHFVYYLDELWETRYPESGREIMEYIMANGLLSSRSITQQEIVPRTVHFKYNTPEDTRLYKEIFRGPVYFGKEENSISYAADIMDHKIPTYNPALLDILQDFAQKMIRDHEAKKDIVSQVKAEIAKSGKYKITREDEVAAALNMSRRTLQQKLQEMNTTFLKILDSIRKELAVAYLESDATSNKEIAWILGYNDISNFYRAFKRWTGLTPNEYRSANG